MASKHQIHAYGQRSWYIDESYTRMFLLEGDEKALLIDTGLDLSDVRQTASELTRKPILLANTHGDPDHSSGNHHFPHAYMHPAEYCMVEKAALQSCQLVPLWENQSIDLGSRVIRPILIPGHTPGSVAYLDESSRILYGGDSVQNGTIFLFGSGRDVETYLASMQKLWSMREHFDRIYASHGPAELEPSFLQVLIQHAQDVLSGTAPYELMVTHGTEVRAYRKELLTFLCPK